MKSVLVTGSSSGIGYATVQYLSKNGYHVYAGARKSTDLERLSQIDNVTPVALDITNHGDIAGLIADIMEKKTGLYALVNNAGIAIDGPLMEIDERLLREQFDVNVIGTVNITKAMFPLIKQSVGRIVNISSVGGKLTNPFLVPYHMSKYAIESFSDGLRRELDPFGIYVSCIEPGVINTPIWTKSREVKRYFEGDFGARADKLKRIMQKIGSKGLSPETVAKVIYHAIDSKKPKIRYLVTNNNLSWRVRFRLPDSFVDRMFRKRL